MRKYGKDFKGLRFKMFMRAQEEDMKILMELVKTRKKFVRNSEH